MILWVLDVCLSVHRCICVEKKTQLDVTECFIALMIRSKCFGHFYAHHQELETICVLLSPMVCDALVAGCRGSDAGQQAVTTCSIPLPGLTACCSAPDPWQPATKVCTVYHIHLNNILSPYTTMSNPLTLTLLIFRTIDMLYPLLILQTHTA
jgi:hypothetical protein